MTFFRMVTSWLARWKPPSAAHRVGRALTAALLIAIVAYGALLRFDALTLKYGPVRAPSWLRSLQQTRAPGSVLRPREVTWDPVPTYPHRDGPPTQYLSDPYTYLQYAREMSSFYAAHREGDYGYLMNERDRELMAWVRAFNPYDLYSKSPVRPDRKLLEPYYRELVSEFFPEPLRF